MKKIKLVAFLGSPVLALVLGTSAQAQQVTMTLVNPNNNGATLSEYGSSFQASVGGTQIIFGNDYIGLYEFAVTEPSALSSPIWATCVSPAGTLSMGASGTYNITPFSQANPGVYPSSWAWNGSSTTPQYWGIQNADYLFSLTAQLDVNPGTSKITSVSGEVGSADDQATALALAMYDVLYNSTTYGNAGAQDSSDFHFVDGGPAGNVGTDYAKDIAYLNAANPTAIASLSGDVLIPTNIAQDKNGPTGQEQIFLTSDLANGSPVPEPSTIIAGALMLLPLGVSAVRILRKNRAV